MKATEVEAAPGPVPSLSLKDAVAITVGIVVGAGIFRTPSLVAANAGSEAAALLVWLAGGLVSLVGALCYAELATAYPHAGGDYHYLTRAYGRRLAFLFAWSRIAVIQTGSAALLAFVFGDYASQLLRLGEHSPSVYAALMIVALTGLNVLGVRQGARTQNWLTAVEVLSLLTVIVAGLTLAAAEAPAAPAATGQTPETQGAGTSGAAPGLALVFVLLTYGGWNEAAYVSAEVRGPRRNVARALLLSIAVITGLYMLVNWAYLRGLGLAGVAGSEAVAADLMRRAAGERGAQFVSLLVAVSALTSANATVITGARTSYALGRDFRLFDFLGRWRGRANTPANALVVQGAIALTLVLAGTLARGGFASMVEYTAPVFWLFFFLTGLSLVVLRFREPEVTRPFRAPLYPLTPLLFCAACLYMLQSSLAYTGLGALAGVAVLLAGVPVLWFATRHQTRPAAPASAGRVSPGIKGPHLLAAALTLAALSGCGGGRESARAPANSGVAGNAANFADAPPEKVPLDVPYVPTPESVVAKMLEVAKVNSDDLLYDLGSGDGRIVITAARRYGARGVGYDLNPRRIQESNDNARAAGVTDRVRFVQQNLFEADLAGATVVTLYLLPDVNLKLRPKLLRELAPGTRVVSHNYPMGDWEPISVDELDVGGVKHYVYYWVVPPGAAGSLRTNSRPAPHNGMHPTATAVPEPVGPGATPELPPRQTRLIGRNTKTERGRKGGGAEKSGRKSGR